MQLGIFHAARSSPFGRVVSHAVLLAEDKVTMQEAVALIGAMPETFERHEWSIPVKFRWCRTEDRIRDRIQRGKQEEKFYLFLFDRTILPDLNEFLQVANVAGIEICYDVEYNERIKHAKIRYTSRNFCLLRWHFIGHKTSQFNAHHFARLRDGRQIDFQGKADSHRKELMKVTEWN